MIKKIFIFLGFLILPHFASATVYYIDFVNGNDTHAGTKEGNYTMDVGSGVATIVDSELSSGTDSFYVGDFVYNVTRNASSFVTAYVGATKTMTISPTITGQTDGDIYYVLKSFQSINQFANNARSAGDIAFIRRGQASTTNVTSVTFTSSGTLNNPIIITADYDNIWNENATSSVTGTFTFGEKYIATSASTTDAFPTKWIYVLGECFENKATLNINPCEYAYEIESASSTGISLYLPYKGTQAGSGKAIRVMPSNPQVGTITEANTIFALSSDTAWYFKGIDVRSTNSSNYIMAINQSPHIIVYDFILQSDGVTSIGIAPGARPFLKKIRTFNIGTTFTPLSGAMSGMVIEDSLVDCNNIASSVFITVSNTVGGETRIKNSEVRNCSDFYRGTTNAVFDIYISNVKRNNSFNSYSGGSLQNLNFSDDFSIVGLSSRSSNHISSNTLSTTTISTTTVTRTGGGSSTQFTMPPSGTGSTGISTKNFPHSYIKIFEYPIYADTSSKTYTMYFMSTSTTNWTTDPITQTLAGSSTPELYIECEYYAGTGDADRMLKRSNTANDVDFNGSTDWQDISVTCQPTQSGVLYLRGWYAKPKEAPSNWFFMDTTPVIQ